MDFIFFPTTKISTPIIRKEIRDLPVTNEGHYTVYLPAYSDKKIIRLLSCFPQKRWEVFSKHSKEGYWHDNIQVKPVNNDAFIRSMAASEGVLCGAGFQTPSEALFLKKKLLVVPMKGQYEQQCNGAALKLLGIPVLKNIKVKHFVRVKQWMEEENNVLLHFPDETEYILDEILQQHSFATEKKRLPEESITKPSAFRNLLLRKIFYNLKA